MLSTVTNLVQREMAPMAWPPRGCGPGRVPTFSTALYHVRSGAVTRAPPLSAVAPFAGPTDAQAQGRADGKGLDRANPQGLCGSPASRPTPHAEPGSKICKTSPEPSAPASSAPQPTSPKGLQGPVPSPCCDLPGPGVTSAEGSMAVFSGRVS